MAYSEKILDRVAPLALQGITPAQVLARLPEQDARYREWEARLREVLRGSEYKKGRGF